MATTYDKASLVMIPSGVKESKLYSIKPTDGSGDFTFSRGTDTATRVNASGLIEKERSNQLLQSNSFNITWTTSNASVTSGQSGYDGSNDAWLLQNNSGSTTSAVLQQNISSGSSVRSFSVYAKAGNVNWLRILLYDGAVTYQSWFNLTDGSTANSSNIINATSTSVGNGWYRCEISANTNITFANIYPTAVAGSSLSDNGANIYIQDAMLNAGLVAQPYIETTTAAVYEGITDNLPRLDYSGGASCPSLLLEPSRTNLVEYSEYLDALAKIGMTITANATTSPEGLVNASKIAYVSGTAYVVAVTGITTGIDQTFSGFFKADESNYVIVNQAGAGATNAVYNLADGTHSGASGITTDMIDYGNGWWRIIYTANLTYNAFRVFMSSNGGYNNYPSAGEGFFAWGFQVESGSYPTSYIPTYGAIASRASDAPSLTSVSDLIGQEQGTFFVEWENIGDISRPYLALSAGGSTANRVLIYESGGVNAQIKSQASVVFQSTTASVSGTIKAAVAYNTNDFVFYVNGTQYGTDSSGTTFSGTTLSEIEFDHAGLIGASIKQTLLFKTRLTNAELAALTTI